MTTETTPWKVSLSEIDFDEAEERAVLEVVRSRWLTVGGKTAEFERRFAEQVGAAHAVATSNCTTALHLALLAVGVRPGDEVLVPSLTFVATANAVLYCGAVPVFVDVEGPERPLFDPEDAARKVSSKTRALVPMHYGGYVCDLDAIEALASDHGVRIVADAAHAPGATRGGRPIGGRPDVACYSFFGNKNLVTGEGGMVTTDDDEIAATVRLNRSHGMTALSYDKHRGHAFSYDVVSTGYNYRMTEMQAALGIVQLGKLDRANAARREAVRRYTEALRRIPEVVVPFTGDTSESACHIFPVVLPPAVDRTRVQAAMRSRGVQTSVHYAPVHGFRSFRERFSADVPVTDALAPRLLTLPLHPRLTEAEIEIVVGALEGSIAEATEGSS